MEFVGSKVCLDGNARHAIATDQLKPTHVLAKWRPVLNSARLPRLMRLNIVKHYNVAGFSLELECMDDDQGTMRQHFELECENGGKRDWREEATVETVAQDGSQMDREMQHERRVCHQRTSTQLGRSCCQDGLQGNLCEGLEMLRTSMVEMETAPLGRNGERQNGLANTHSVSKSTGGRTWWRRRFPNSLETLTVFRNQSRTTRDGCIHLKTVRAGGNL